MVDREREVRHNPSRTFVPGHFVDLGKLFDEDSRRELLNTPEPLPDRRFVPDFDPYLETAEEMDGVGTNGIIGDDFMIGGNGVTDTSDNPTTR